MGRPRSSLVPARKRAIQPDSFLVKHYALFNSLARHALDEPIAASASSRKRGFYSEQAANKRARKLARLRRQYPAGGISSYTWPLPFPRLPAYSQTPKERLDELVYQVVRDTFDADYAMFRSPQWAKEHRITREHKAQIIVDPNQVDESAVAAKELVETVLSRFITAVKRGTIGTRDSTTKGKGKEKDSRSSSETTTTAPSTETPEAQSSSADGDAALDTGDPELDERELDEEIGQVDPFALNWQELLDYLESTGGSSKSAQWRNWHLLNAIAKTRERCEELFAHQFTRMPC